ncbi:MAG: EF-hand domain-containing protein [Burkholderiales bacterium]
MKMFELKKSIRLAAVPVICAGLLSACASYEHEVVHRTTSAAPPARVITLFDQLDTNHDGFLSRAEVEPLGLPVSGYSFEGLDINRDGFLSRSEASSLIASTQVTGGRWVVITRASFESLDVDRDGFLTRREAEPVMNGALFERYDTNRDGFLSRSEADPFFHSNVGGTAGASGATVIYGPR